MFGGSGARFVVNFSIEGSGERDLGRISNAFKGLNKSISGNESGAPVEGKGIMAGLDGGLEVMEKMGEAGLGLIEIGSGIVEGWGKAFEVLLHKGSEFESLILRIQGSGKTRGQAIQMMEDSLEITKQLPLTEMDAARITQTFSTIHIDATKRMGESYEELAKKQKTMKGLDEILGVDRMKKEGPKAITVVGDMLAAMGHLGTGYQTQAIHEMMVTLETGKIMSKLTFAGLGGDLEKFKHMLQKTKEPADRLLAMQEILSKRGALGLSQASMNTWGGVMSNFKGILDQVSYAILQPGQAGGLLAQLTRGAKDLYDTIAEFFDKHSEKGAKFLSMLRETFQMVGGWMTYAAQKLDGALKFVLGFMADHPTLMKFAAGMSFVVAGLLIATGVFLVASAALGGLILAFTVMPELMLAPLAILALFPPIIGLIAAAVLTGIAVWQAWEHDLGGIKTLMEDIKLVFAAVGEAFDDWHGGMASISEETAKKMEERGLMGVFLKVINIMRQAQMAYEGFVDGFSHKWEEASPKLERAWARITGTLRQVTNAVESVLVAFGLMARTGQDAVDDATSSGESFGAMIGDVANGIASIVEFGSKMFTGLLSYVPMVIEGFTYIYAIGLRIAGGFEFAKGAAEMMFHAIEAGIGHVMAALVPLIDLLQGVVNAHNRLMHADFSGAAASLGDAWGSAKGDAEAYRMEALKHQQLAGEAADASDAGFKKMATAGETADAYKFDALSTYARLTAGQNVGPTPPAAIGPPPAYGTWDGTNAAETKDSLDIARNGGQRPPPTPVNQTLNLTIDGEVIGKVVHKFIADSHEQGGGFSKGEH